MGAYLRFLDSETSHIGTPYTRTIPRYTGGSEEVPLPGGSGTFAHVSVHSTQVYY